MNTIQTLHPRLVVADPDTALDFYQHALGARLVDRFTDNRNQVVHAAFSINNAIVSLTHSMPEWGLFDPHSLGGSACLLHLTVANPDESAERMVKMGGKILIEIADRPYGRREGRVADPSGHLWILSKTIEALSDAEIGRRLQGH